MFRHSTFNRFIGYFYHLAPKTNKALRQHNY